ncbi:hypothetical protein F2Q69_00058924 [Brassica cretica]|uniref:Uncharacterized protein n=1 Tax=Brassica cretica TaxID=69181 RepID=A0A8S9RBF4_BRACR|nr:hypothetical protein F2Q69_00058924 [Brassica cretica]
MKRKAARYLENIALDGLDGCKRVLRQRHRGQREYLGIEICQNSGWVTRRRRIYFRSLRPLLRRRSWSGRRLELVILDELDLIIILTGGSPLGSNHLRRYDLKGPLVLRQCFLTFGS